MADGDNDTEIHITHLVNPHFFYFRWKKDDGYDEKLDQLEAKVKAAALDKTYSQDESEGSSKIMLNKVVAVFVPNWHKWIRASVKKKVNNDSYCVWACDYGVPMVLNSSFIRKLPSSFTGFHLKNNRIHIGGIGNVVPVETNYDVCTGSAKLEKLQNWSSESIKFTRGLIKDAIQLNFEQAEVPESFTKKPHYFGRLMLITQGSQMDIVKALLEMRHAVLTHEFHKDITFLQTLDVTPWQSNTSVLTTNMDVVPLLSVAENAGYSDDEFPDDEPTSPVDDYHTADDNHTPEDNEFFDDSVSTFHPTKYQQYSRNQMNVDLDATNLLNITTPQQDPLYVPKPQQSTEVNEGNLVQPKNDTQNSNSSKNSASKDDRTTNSGQSQNSDGSLTEKLHEIHLVQPPESDLQKGNSSKNSSSNDHSTQKNDRATSSGQNQNSDGQNKKGRNQRYKRGQASNQNNRQADSNKVQKKNSNGTNTNSHPPNSRQSYKHRRGKPVEPNPEFQSLFGSGLETIDESSSDATPQNQVNVKRTTPNGTKTTQQNGLINFTPPGQHFQHQSNRERPPNGHYPQFNRHQLPSGPRQLPLRQLPPGGPLIPFRPPENPQYFMGPRNMPPHMIMNHSPNGQARYHQNDYMNHVPPASRYGNNQRGPMMHPNDTNFRRDSPNHTRNYQNYQNRNTRIELQAGSANMNRENVPTGSATENGAASKSKDETNSTE